MYIVYTSHTYTHTHTHMRARARTLSGIKHILKNILTTRKQTTRKQTCKNIIKILINYF